MNCHKKIVGAEQLRAFVKEAEGNGRTVVQCHGLLFNILHPGHASAIWRGRASKAIC
jgi:hypothetical protein